MGEYEGAEQALVDKWVEAQLAAEAVALNFIATDLSNKVFLEFAPEGTAYPFIIYQCQSPPRDVRGVGVTRVFVDTLYVVKAVAQTNSYDTLAPIARVIDRAMTSQVGAPVSDGAVFSSIREEGFNLIEVDQGTQFRHLGGTYKIQAQG